MSIEDNPPDCKSVAATGEPSTGGSSLSRRSLASITTSNLSRPAGRDRVAPNRPSASCGATMLWDNAGAATIKTQQVMATESKPSFSVGSTWSVATLPDEDRVAREQLDILLDVLASDNIVVVELVTTLLAVLVAHDHDVAFVGVLQKSARLGDSLQDLHLRSERERPRLGDFTDDVHFTAANLLD